MVFTLDKFQEILNRMEGTNKLIAELMCGAGLPVSEVLKLRYMDLDFSYNQIQVRSGKGKKDCITIMPQALKRKLKNQLERVKILPERVKVIIRRSSVTVRPPTVKLITVLCQLITVF